MVDGVLVGNFYTSQFNHGRHWCKISPSFCSCMVQIYCNHSFGTCNNSTFQTLVFIFCSLGQSYVILFIQGCIVNPQSFCIHVRLGFKLLPPQYALNNSIFSVQTVPYLIGTFVVNCTTYQCWQMFGGKSIFVSRHFDGANCPSPKYFLATCSIPVDIFSLLQLIDPSSLFQVILLI